MQFASAPAAHPGSMSLFAHLGAACLAAEPPAAPRDLPPALRDAYTIAGAVPVADFYVDEAAPTHYHYDANEVLQYVAGVLQVQLCCQFKSSGLARHCPETLCLHSFLMQSCEQPPPMPCLQALRGVSSTSVHGGNCLKNPDHQGYGHSQSRMTCGSTKPSWAIRGRSSCPKM